MVESKFKRNIAELEFAKLFQNKRFSSKKEDIEEHFDLEIKTRVDVKGLKKINRHDQQVNECYHYVEIKNVHGKAGWLYGNADYFAFELEEYWIIVEKQELQNFIKRKVIKEFTKTKTLYKLYNRKNRKDVITLVKSIDLIYISKKLIKKK